MHDSLYSAPAIEGLLHFSDPRRPPPGLSRTPRADDALAEPLRRLLSADPSWRARSARVAEAQGRLRRLVSSAAWQAYLDLEEQDVARWNGALLLVANWASARGRARRRRRHQRARSSHRRH